MTYKSHDIALDLYTGTQASPSVAWGSMCLSVHPGNVGRRPSLDREDGFEVRLAGDVGAGLAEQQQVPAVR